MSDNLKNDIKSVELIHKDNINKKEPQFKEPQYVMHCLTESTRYDRIPIKGNTRDKNKTKGNSSVSDDSKN